MERSATLRPSNFFRGCFHLLRPRTRSQFAEKKASVSAIALPTSKLAHSPQRDIPSTCMLDRFLSGRLLRGSCLLPSTTHATFARAIVCPSRLCAPREVPANYHGRQLGLTVCVSFRMGFAT